ncbi:MAG TPA: DUF4340 domain-containing protein [Burkholderiales bacterium]|jgi:hypothetical protein|nr:DUF4340 domain-containing protein [Burkholderiales bacterium]
MKAKVILNLVLVLAVTAVALFAILKPQQQKADPGIRLLDMTRDQVSRIAIERKGAPAVRLEKQGDGWHVTAPFTARADRNQVDRILDLTGAVAKQKLPRGDLGRFDLDPPQLRVTLDDRAVAFGRINEVTNEQYAATADAVYLLAPFYGYGIPDEGGKLASRKLLGDDEHPVAFDFGGYRVERDDKGRWSEGGASAAQAKVPVSQDEFNRWADEWRVTHALAVEPYKGGAGKQRIAVKFRNGKSVNLLAGTTPAGFTLLRTDQNMLYRFGAEVGRRLMDPHVAAARAAAN